MIASGGEIEMVRALEPVNPRLSVTVIVKLTGVTLPTVGVPLIVPSAGEIISPVGKDPEDTDQVKGRLTVGVAAKV